MHERKRERIRETEQWSEAISSLYFLDTQKAGFVCGRFIFFFPPRFHVKAIEVA